MDSETYMSLCHNISISNDFTVLYDYCNKYFATSYSLLHQKVNLPQTAPITDITKKTISFIASHINLLRVIEK